MIGHQTQFDEQQHNKAAFMGNFSPKLLKRNLWESLQSPQKLFLVGAQNEAFHTKARGSNFYLSEAKWSNFHFECEASKLKA